MQKIILFLTLGFLQFHAISQTSTPSILGDKIFSAFKAKDYKAYRSLLIDSVDYKEFLKDYFKNDPIARSSKKNFSRKEPGFPDSFDVQQSREFIRLIKEGEKLGIEWSEIESPTFSYKKDKDSDSKIKSISGYLKFNFKGKSYMIFGIESSLFSSGYKIIVVLAVMDFKLTRQSSFELASR